MLRDNNSAHQVATLLVENTILILLMWTLQLFKVRWLFMQPIRPLPMLLFFSLFYTILIIVLTNADYSALKKLEKIAIDWSIILMPFLGVFILLPQAFTADNFFNGNGIVSFFIAAFGLMILYMPEYSPNYIQLLPYPHRTKFIALKYRRVIAYIFIILSILWLLDCGLKNGINMDIPPNNHI